MSRALTVLFRRDPSRDRQCENIAFEGHNVLWPDGRPVAVGPHKRALDASEQTAGFLGHLGEHVFRGVFLGDERRDPPQGRLLLDEEQIFGLRLDLHAHALPD